SVLKFGSADTSAGGASIARLRSWKSALADTAKVSGGGPPSRCVMAYMCQPLWMSAVTRSLTTRPGLTSPAGAEAVHRTMSAGRWARAELEARREVTTPRTSAFIRHILAEVSE